MTIYFSASTLGFYDDLLRENYEQSGTWPGDAMQISDVKYRALMNGQSSGKVIALNGSGMPVLVPPAPPSKEQIIADAIKTKSQLMGEAAKVIAPLQDAVDLAMATDEESSQLLDWKQYRVLLNRISPSMAPDIDWPPVPTLII